MRLFYECSIALFNPHASALIIMCVLHSSWNFNHEQWRDLFIKGLNGKGFPLFLNCGWIVLYRDWIDQVCKFHKSGSAWQHLSNSRILCQNRKTEWILLDVGFKNTYTLSHTTMSSNTVVCVGGSVRECSMDSFVLVLLQLIISPIHHYQL